MPVLISTDVTVEPATVPATAGQDLADRFREMYRADFGRVAGYAYRLTRDAEAADDIAQEAFTRLLARWVSVRDPRAYLFHVATNLARAAWLARARAARTTALAAAEQDRDPAPDNSVLDAIARLPPRHREVVFLHYYADLPVVEVAAAVRRPAGTVKRELSEARARLARSLGGNDD